MSRDIDWVSYIGRLVFCYGCGRFGVPAKNGRPPRGWSLLYQPHADAPPGLLVCAPSCASAVREAMTDGPVHEPLKMGAPPPMPQKMKDVMLRDVIWGVIKEVLDKLELDEPDFSEERAIKVVVDTIMQVPTVHDVTVVDTDFGPVLEVTNNPSTEAIVIRFADYKGERS